MVPVVAAQHGIAIGRFHFENAITDFQNRYVKGTSTQVEDRNFLVALLVETISQRGRGWFVDDTENIETRNLASVFSRLTLTIIKVGRDRNDRFGYRLAQISFCIRLKLRQNEGSNLLRSELLRLVAHLTFDKGVTVVSLNNLKRNTLRFRSDFSKLAANQPLCRKYCIFWVGNCLALGRLAN